MVAATETSYLLSSHDILSACPLLWETAPGEANPGGSAIFFAILILMTRIQLSAKK